MGCRGLSGAAKPSDAILFFAHMSYKVRIIASVLKSTDIRNITVNTGGRFELDRIEKVRTQGGQYSFIEDYPS